MRLIHRMSLDERIVIRQPDAFEDHFVIERHDHDGRVWHEEDEDGSRRMQSANLSPEATIDGNREEMLGLARVIRAGGASTVTFKRCAAVCVPGGVLFWSPKNSDTDVLVKWPWALDLASQIFEKLGA